MFSPMIQVFIALLSFSESLACNPTKYLFSIVTVNSNSIVQHVIQIENGIIIIKHENVNVKTITSAKKIIVGILSHAFVRTGNI